MAEMQPFRRNCARPGACPEPTSRPRTLVRAAWQAIVEVPIFAQHRAIAIQSSSYQQLARAAFRPEHIPLLLSP